MQNTPNNPEKILQIHISIQLHGFSRCAWTQRHFVILRTSGWVCVCGEGVKRGAEDYPLSFLLSLCMCCVGGWGRRAHPPEKFLDTSMVVRMAPWRRRRRRREEVRDVQGGITQLFLRLFLLTVWFFLFRAREQGPVVYFFSSILAGALGCCFTVVKKAAAAV